jgi:hypothetical protein
MYIFSRRVTARPDQLAQGLAAAVEIGQKASTVAGRPIGVYHARFGAPMGSILYSTRVETMAELEAMTNKMSADKKYAEWIAPMRAMFTPPEDAVVSIISSSITAPGARYVSGTMAIPANGKVAAAVEFGVKVQSHMSNAGFKSAFGSYPFGPYGALQWLTALDSWAELDKLNGFFATDPGFAAFLVEAGTLFVEGSATNTLVEKIG